MHGPINIKNQIDVTCYFILLLIGSTFFGHYCAYHQELATLMLITTLVVSFCKDGGVNVNLNLCFLVVHVRCDVLCHFVVAVQNETTNVVINIIVKSS